MDIFVARQPILSAKEEIIGYELLYRENQNNFFPASNPDRATFNVMFNSFLDIGFEKLTHGKTAFINFTRNALIERLPFLLPHTKITVEILEDIKSDPEVINVLRDLKDNDYTIALDDFLLDEKNYTLLPFADIVKVDWLDSSDEDITYLLRESLPFSPKFLAEKIESKEQFLKAKSMGFTMFQGYYFSSPMIISNT